MLSQKNFQDIDEFENSLITPKKQTNKRELYNNNITNAESEYTPNEKENSINFSDISDIDTKLATNHKTQKKKSNYAVIDSKFDLTENTTRIESKHANKYENISKLDIAKDVAKAAVTLNPLHILKAAKHAKNLKKKSSKLKKLLMVFTLVPVLTTLLVGALAVYIVVFTDSSNVLSPKAVIQLRYSQLLKNGTVGKDIIQKVHSDKTVDTTLPTINNTEEDKKPTDAQKSDKYLTVTTSSVPYFSQHDPRWKDTEYCPGETYSQSACGVTSLAMLLTYLKYTELDSDKDGVTLPTDTGSYSLSHGYVTSQGTAVALFMNLPNLKSEYLSPSEDLDRIKSILAKGEPLIYSVNGSTTFASSHLMVATGYKDGMWTVNDPNNYEFSNKEWNESDFLSGAYYFIYIHK